MARLVRGLATKALFTGGTALICAWFYGQHKPEPTKEPPTKKIASQEKEEGDKPKRVTEKKPSSSHGTIKESVRRLLEKNEGGIFPKGTQIQSVTLREGVATLDFNSAFQAVQDSGESSEAEVQRTLRATLADFPSVQQMRVTVEGRNFESQATDWGKPFDVRESSASR